MLRTHTCGELRIGNKGESVKTCGWVHNRRDHGGVIFIDLRDRYGLTQVVFDPSHNKESHAQAEKLRREDVIQCSGRVRHRGKNLENPNLETGQIEIIVDNLSVLNASETPPLEVDDYKTAKEDARLKWRYLDLRRPAMVKNMRIRHAAAQAARRFLSIQNFFEMETPLLVKSTPEGARDYVVPSRIHPGKFYSLPQSPQIYKEILMIAGMDRYFQFARCLRDEDLRQDRQPEHTQIDIEMSFAKEEDVFAIVEGMCREMFKESLGVKLDVPFQRMAYDEAMSWYGTDKPDLRFDLKLIDVGDVVKDSNFSIFKDVVAKGGVVKCLNPDVAMSRKQIEDYTDFAASHGAKGLAWMKVTDKGPESSIVKFFSEDVQKALLKKTNANKDSTLLFIADTKTKTNDILSRLRNKLGKDLKLVKDEWRFVWITNFPLFEWNDEEEKWYPLHHMFCQPKEEHIQYLESDPGKVYCTQYDLVLNGMELGSGSCRIVNPELQNRVLNVIGYDKKSAEEAFGFLMEAMKYGAPPMAGIGFGFDRAVALMCGTTDIREVMAFPKTKSQESPMDGCPSAISHSQAKELHLKIDAKKRR